MAGKRRCVFEGCRAWARKGTEWCVAHPGGEARRGGGAPRGNQNARTHGWHAKYVPIGVLKEALERPPEDLRLEIAVARALVQEVARRDLPPEEMLKALDTGFSMLSRLMRTNRALEGSLSSELQEGTLQALEEMGLG